MEKLTAILLLFSILNASNLEKNCLNCHKAQKIPSSQIYKRYLLKFSTKDNIAKAMIKYLKNPNKENSILPKQFFIKFPLKKAVNLNDNELNKSVYEFIEKFDLKKRLYIPKRK